MLRPAPPQPVPAGPLAVRFVAYELPPLPAGTSAIVRVELENAGTATWRSLGAAAVRASYHWHDRYGNPLVWEGLRTDLPGPLAPGDRALLELRVPVPIPPGPYRLAVDLVDEGRFWFAELGNRPLELDVDVGPRLARRALAARIGAGREELAQRTRAALAAQEEPLVEDGEAVAFLAPGCRPAPDWSRRLLDAHAEGYAAVAGSIAVDGGLLGRRARARELAPWSPGFGRSPGWTLPLLCPSLVSELAADAPWGEPVAGLPALDPARLDEPWLCDGRIRIAVPASA